MPKHIGFRQMTHELELSNGAYRVNIEPAWRQGRTVHGGIVTGLALSAALKAFSDLPPLRAVMVNFIGPCGPSPRFIPQILRQGKNVTTIGVDALSEGVLASRMSFSFGKMRSSKVFRQITDPVHDKDPDQYPAFTPVFARLFVPKFFLNFDTRFISGARPLAGDKRGYINAYTRHIDPASREGLDSFLVLADVLPPAALVTQRKMGPVSSITWSINILTDEVKTDDGWWRIDNQMTQAANGYSSQLMGYWNRRGEKVAEAMQTVAIFI